MRCKESPWSRAAGTSSPRPHIHRLLQALLDLPTPAYHHHRLLTGAHGERLAKRDKAATLRSLREAGRTPAESTRDDRVLRPHLLRQRMMFGHQRLQPVRRGHEYRSASSRYRHGPASAARCASRRRGREDDWRRNGAARGARPSLPRCRLRRRDRPTAARRPIASRWPLLPLPGNSHLAGARFAHREPGDDGGSRRFAQRHHASLPPLPRTINVARSRPRRTGRQADQFGDAQTGGVEYFEQATARSRRRRHAAWPLRAAPSRPPRIDISATACPARTVERLGRIVAAQVFGHEKAMELAQGGQPPRGTAGHQAATV